MFYSVLLLSVPLKLVLPIASPWWKYYTVRSCISPQAHAHHPVGKFEI